MKDKLAAALMVLTVTLSAQAFAEYGGDNGDCSGNGEGEMSSSAEARSAESDSADTDPSMLSSTGPESAGANDTRGVGVDIADISNHSIAPVDTNQGGLRDND